MSKNYTEGRYNVYKGRGPLAPLIGRVDEDEFVRGDRGQLLYRIDGDEFYDMSGNLIGQIVASGEVGMVVSSDPAGQTCHFMISEE